MSGYGAQLARLGGVNLVRPVDLLDGHIGRNGNDVHVVDAAEFFGHGLGRAGHAGDFVEMPEIILEGDGREGLGLTANGDAFLGFDGLVEPVGKLAGGHDAPGVLIDDDDFPVLNDVVHAVIHHAVGVEGLLDVVDQGGIFGGGQIVDVEKGFGFGDARFGQGDDFVLLVLVVIRCVQGFDEPVGPFVLAGVPGGFARDD